MHNLLLPTFIKLPLVAAAESDNGLLPANRRPSGFLAVNPKFTAMHNQARQKLGTLNSRDFTALIIDVLTETRRRQFGTEHSPKHENANHKELFHHSSMAVVPHTVASDNQMCPDQPPKSRSTLSSFPVSQTEHSNGSLDFEGPLYDVVAHDDDYMDFTQFINPTPIPAPQNCELDENGPVYAQVLHTRHMDKGKELTAQVLGDDSVGNSGGGSVTVEQYMEIKRFLKDTIQREKNLSDQVYAMKSDLDHLYNQVFC